MKSLLTKPVLVTSAVQSTLTMLVAFGVGLKDEQTVAILAWVGVMTAIANVVLYGMEPKK